MCDRRFANVHMEPVGAFTQTADITAIHSLDKGLTYVKELHPSAWLLRGLRDSTRLDVIRSKDGAAFATGSWKDPILSTAGRIAARTDGAGRIWN
jgi:hypothetical protein